MAASTSAKLPCATCGKVTGVFTCRGCQKDFCKRHVAEHQQELSKQLDELTLEHDQFRQTLSEQTQEPRNHPLMKQINEWEEESINKIRQAANDARKQIENLLGEHATKLTKALTEMAQDLCKAREDDDFYETDLKQWVEKLNKLKKDLAQPPNINIKRENNNAIFVTSKIVTSISSNELFGRLMGNVTIKDNGQVVVKNEPKGYATVRGKGEYSSGQHRFRFRIEVNGENKWLFIGIISKNVPMQEASFCSQSSYGWAGNSQVFTNGSRHYGSDRYEGDVERNDIVELFIDCDQRRIHLTNEQTHSAYTLAVATNQCAFPWQLNFNLYHVNDRVCILQN